MDSVRQLSSTRTSRRCHHPALKSAPQNSKSSLKFFVVSGQLQNLLFLFDQMGLRASAPIPIVYKQRQTRFPTTPTNTTRTQDNRRYLWHCRDFR